MTDRLSTICRWIFAFLTVASLLGAAGILAFMVINPPLERHAQGGASIEMTMPPDMAFLNKKGTVVSVTGLRTYVTDKDEHELAVLIKRYGLPLGLVSALFTAVIFDLFRRLFRNVERGKSFAPETIALMRGIGFSLLGYSVVSVIAENLFVLAMRDYFRSHTALLGPGIVWSDHLPLRLTLDLGSSDFTFVGSLFFAGLLVLALSEVFRQGLALKSDNDLTI